MQIESKLRYYQVQGIVYQETCSLITGEAIRQEEEGSEI